MNTKSCSIVIVVEHSKTSILEETLVTDWKQDMHLGHRSGRRQYQIRGESSDMASLVSPAASSRLAKLFRPRGRGRRKCPCVRRPELATLIPPRVVALRLSLTHQYLVCPSCSALHFIIPDDDMGSQLETGKEVSIEGGGNFEVRSA